MYTIALLGAGRIAKVHVREHRGDMPGRTLAYVVDVDQAAAESMADGARCEGGGRRTPRSADPEVAAIVIASSTPTHSDYIEAGAAAGKHVFCEKPIDLDSARVRECLANIEGSGIRLIVGFNRRFDPHFRHLKSELDAGAIGRLEQLLIHLERPGAAPRRLHPGIGRDLPGHDHPRLRPRPLPPRRGARRALGERLHPGRRRGRGPRRPRHHHRRDADRERQARRSSTNSRRSTYGYDQRIEAHGSEGILSAGNVPESTLVHGGAHGFTGQKAMHFFLERYSAAYRAEWDHFVNVLDGSAEPTPTGVDGARALAMADAAYESLESGRRVTLALD